MWSDVKVKQKAIVIFVHLLFETRIATTEACGGASECDNRISTVFRSNYGLILLSFRDMTTDGQLTTDGRTDD